MRFPASGACEGGRHERAFELIFVAWTSDALAGILTAFEPGLATQETHARGARLGKGGHGQQDDAVDGAGRQAQAAAGAFVLDHRVHAFGRTEDGVHGAGLETQRAADAIRFDDTGDLGRLRWADFGIEGGDGYAE